MYVKVNTIRLVLMLYVVSVIISVISARLEAIIVWDALMLQEIQLLRIANALMGIIM